MHQDFARPALNREQKARLKALYERDNHHGLLAIGTDFAWIGAAVALPVFLSFWLTPLSIVVIGARQRALASLLHEAAHGTLFRNTALNRTVGRILCGWTVLQSLGAYRESHVLSHHPRIGEDADDPDLRFMLAEGVYDRQSRSEFLWRFVVLPLLGGRTLKYVGFLLNDRLLGGLRQPEQRPEVLQVLAFHALLAGVAAFFGVVPMLLLFWWLPFLLIHPIIGWFSELSEHFPMMKEGAGGAIYSSRNRYANFIETMLIGMHGDNYHLTHHLLPGVPHWNLEKATRVLREESEFKAWDDAWGGIFSSSVPGRVNLLGYIMNYHRFDAATADPLFLPAGRKELFA